MRRSVSSDEEQVVRASQRLPPYAESILQSPKKGDADARVAAHQQNVETSSTSDSILEMHFSDGASPCEQGEATWCVFMPSEAVLLFDSLTGFCSEFGKVLAVHDVNE